jgi:hypothetical protein
VNKNVSKRRIEMENLNSKTILVVDDEIIIAMATGDKLKRVE